MKWFLAHLGLEGASALNLIVVTNHSGVWEVLKQTNNKSQAEH